MRHHIYPIHFTSQPPKLQDLWDNASWRSQSYIEISNFRPESSSHRPLTRLKLLYNEEGIFGIFKVEDRYVICSHTRYQDPVYKDSCVEFFLQPKPEQGYFNFEFNCGGALLSSYITDPTRVPGGFKGVRPLSNEEGRQIEIHTSQPPVIDVETNEPITWQLTFFIPLKLLRTYVGRLDAAPGTNWKANFFKCADESSHPHWAAWSPVDQLNFHLPHCFGVLKLKQ